ncbi:MAG: redoxin domain-containing protein [Bacteroidota bacterium]|nr:redoxin domain-containing protein [Bacteroidota bacterium]
MQKLILFFTLIISFLPCFSQSAPDFTFTDTDGKQWNLYTELNNGKTILLDFFYVNCTPCQTYTPEIVQINNDYGQGEQKLIVWGISDRDNNQSIKQFDTSLNVNYSSCGIEGGGDTITSLFMSWFPFVAWPTYAVICPDKSVNWNVPKSQDFPEIRAAIDSCPDLTNIKREINPSAPYKVYPIPSIDKLNIQSVISGTAVISIYEMTSGKRIIFLEKNFIGETLSISLADLKAGLYTLAIETKDEQFIFKIPIIK